MSGSKVKIPGRKPWEEGGFWQPERIEMLKALHKDGLSASQISAKLEARFDAEVSRNAVIGKLSRLGLATDPTKAKFNVRRSRLPGAPKINPRLAAPAQKPVAPTKPKLAIAENGAVYETADSAPTLPPVNVRAWAPLPGVTPIARDAARPLHCKCPITVAGDELGFCCGSIATDGPYCESHAQIARPKTGAKENLDRRLGIVPRRHAA